MKTILSIGISLVLLLTLLTLVSGERSYFPPPENQGGWRKNTDPEFIRSLGLDPIRVEEFGTYNRSLSPMSFEMTSAIIIKDGWIVGEWYSKPEAVTTPIYTASIGKSFALACFGIARKDSAEGRLPYPFTRNTKLYDPRWLKIGFPLSDPRKSQITFDQVFQHTGGFIKGVGRNEWTDYRAWVVGHDPVWPQNGLLAYPPGKTETFPDCEIWGEHCGLYSSVGFAHLGLVFSNLYDMPAHQFLWSRLLEPIGFKSIDFMDPPQPPEIKWFSGGGLVMTPRDLGRFAYFLMQNGEWKGQQIVDPDWIPSFVSRPKYENLRSNVDGHFGKEYPPDMFRMWGSGSNFVFVVPSLNMIVLRTGRVKNFFLKRVEHDFLRRTFRMVPGYDVAPAL